MKSTVSTWVCVCAGFSLVSFGAGIKLAGRFDPVFTVAGCALAGAAVLAVGVFRLWRAGALAAR